MMFSSNTVRFVLVLAAACNAVTVAKETKVELSKLRGSSPTAPVESLADADSRKLAVVDGHWVIDEWADTDQAKLAVQAGAGLVFQNPGTEIIAGNVCGYEAITGLDGVDYFLGSQVGYDPDTTPAGREAFVGGCNPTSAVDGSISKLLTKAHAIYLSTVFPNAMPLDSGEMGGKTYQPGTYKIGTPLTVAANSVVTLTGNADSKFLFLAGAAMSTGAGTSFVLEGGVLPKNILFYTAAAATTGAGSELEGSILAAAAITLGASTTETSTTVTGGIFAGAAISVGEACAINTAEIIRPSTTESPILSILNAPPAAAAEQPYPTPTR
jgi:hypothetical protein